jgi:hypothetical protein
LDRCDIQILCRIACECRKGAWHILRGTEYLGVHNHPTTAHRISVGLGSEVATNGQESQMIRNLTATLCLTISTFLVQVDPVVAQGHLGARTFKCTQPIPEFSLGPDSNPTNRQIQKLCSCIWGKFPVEGWERRTSKKIKEGIDPGWRGKAFVAKFGKALRECGGDKL